MNILYCGPKCIEMIDLIHKHVIVYLEGNETILFLNIKCSPILSKLIRKKKVRIPGSESGIPHFGLMTCFCLCLENKSPLICDRSGHYTNFWVCIQELEMSFIEHLFYVMIRKHVS